MRANLMWTINDFPAYSIMSGWSTSGILACPSCAENTISEYLHKSKNVCYMGHERFRENPPPPPPSGYDVLSGVGDVNLTFGLNYKTRLVHNGERSVYFLNCRTGLTITRSRSVTEKSVFSGHD